MFVFKLLLKQGDMERNSDQQLAREALRHMLTSKFDPLCVRVVLAAVIAVC